MGYFLRPRKSGKLNLKVRPDIELVEIIAEPFALLLDWTVVGGSRRCLAHKRLSDVEVLRVLEVGVAERRAHHGLQVPLLDGAEAVAVRLWSREDMLVSIDDSGL